MIGHCTIGCIRQAGKALQKKRVVVEEAIKRSATLDLSRQSSRLQAVDRSQHELEVYDTAGYTVETLVISPRTDETRFEDVNNTRMGRETRGKSAETRRYGRRRGKDGEELPRLARYVYDAD